jgi:hypothetical protein
VLHNQPQRHLGRDLLRQYSIGVGERILNEFVCCRLDADRGTHSLHDVERRHASTFRGIQIGPARPGDSESSADQQAGKARRKDRPFILHGLLQFTKPRLQTVELLRDVFPIGGIRSKLQIRFEIGPR